ncbi:MAG TPA: septal ring lytic transglycosylase RlpA family protein [Ignavibacteriaceae bacterium]|nr:septal ring lytic transglycosylase RlpA family protein [Ignavibacteriaceae bacterium]
MFKNINLQKRNAALVFSIFSFIFFSCSSSRFTSDKNKESRYEINRILKTSETIASYYADEFHGKKTASGEIYNMYDLTAAHINYPLGTVVRVTNLRNDRSVVLRINDRKPEGNNRNIDISYKAASELDMIDEGITKVRIEVIKWGDLGGK